MYVQNQQGPFRQAIRKVYKKRDYLDDKLTKKCLNPRRAICREDLPNDAREAKFVACSSSCSVLARTLKRTLLRNSRFQDLMIYVMRHASLLR